MPVREPVHRDVGGLRGGPASPTRGRRRRCAAVLGTLAATLGILLTSVPAGATASYGLVYGRQVYDLTRTSLTPAQVAALNLRLNALRAAGADAVVYIRTLAVTSDQTLSEATGLQAQWAAVRHANPKRAVAILINRDPRSRTRAQAGIFVGSILDTGRVPHFEQVAAIERDLLPALRGGDVYGGLVAAVDRLTKDVRVGPPLDAFQRLATRSVTTWVPATTAALAVVALVIGSVLFGRRRRLPAAERRRWRRGEPPAARPDDSPPAVAGALVRGGSNPPLAPATILDLALQGAVAVENEPGRKPGRSVRLRLVREPDADDPIATAAWTELRRVAVGGVVPARAVRRLARSPRPILRAVRDELRARGWWDESASRPRTLLAVIGGLSLAVAVAAFVLVVWAKNLVPVRTSFAGTFVLGFVGVLALAAAAYYPVLSTAGLREATRWRRYRATLRAAARNTSIAVDLERALPDIVAFGLADAYHRRIGAAARAGVRLRAFDTRSEDTGSADLLALWVGFTATTLSGSSAGAAATMAGSAAAGGSAASHGGGAAGGT